MALWRVLRCHPLASGGLDPVVKRQFFRRSYHLRKERARSGHSAQDVHPRKELCDKK